MAAAHFQPIFYIGLEPIDVNPSKPEIQIYTQLCQFYQDGPKVGENYDCVCDCWLKPFPVEVPSFIFPACCLLAAPLALMRRLIEETATPRMLPYSVIFFKMIAEDTTDLVNDPSCTETPTVQSLKWNILCLCNTQSQFHIGLGFGRFDSFIW